MPPKRVRNLTFFDFFILGRRKHRITKNLHTELKVAVRTCEGKAIHGIHRKVSTYLRVSTRIFLSHEWARTEGRASQFTLMPCGVELSHADGADLRGTTCEAKFLCISVIFVCNFSCGGGLLNSYLVNLLTKVVSSE